MLSSSQHYAVGIGQDRRGGEAAVDVENFPGPVMNDEAREARKMAAPTMSSGCPSLRGGVFSTPQVMKFWVRPQLAREVGQNKARGDPDRTGTSYGPHSSARARARFGRRRLC